VKNSQQWTLNLVEEIKFLTRTELEQVEKRHGVAQRLEHIQKKMSSLIDDDSSLGRLKRYIFAMSALVHYERHGGLNQFEVGKIFELARAILQAQQIQVKSNQLSQLWSDLYLIKGQIDRKWGHSWDAAWNQQLGIHWSQKKDPEIVSLKNLGMGNRALRLGHTRLAYEYFLMALENKLDIHTWGRSRLGAIYCLNYLGRKSEASDMVSQTLEEKLLPRDYIVELQWIQKIHLHRSECGLNEILPKIRKGQDFFSSTYMIETVFWSYAIRTQEFIPRVPRLESIARNKHLKPRKHGEWYQAGIAIQAAYDYDIPLQIRMNGISTAISQRDLLPTIDKELLLLAVAIRWLARIKAHEMARLLWTEYSELSLKMSERLSIDVLGVLDDIKERSWSSSFPIGA
jgi:hypothetical protein